MLGRTIAEWRNAALESGPSATLQALRATLPAGDPAWIHRADEAALEAQLQRLTQRAAQAGGAAQLPLYGVPFAVKDNIDVVGMPTTAGCPAFAYTPGRNATAVQKLTDAGAVVVGKTNLDQFATGLSGTRSPYGAVPNSFDADYVCGGSSSGSASVVARGLVPFALGTDTAGSGRVPAGFNNLVGLKPTRGWVSTHGVVPACRSLDCVSVFALTVDDARTAVHLAAGGDAHDPYSRVAPRDRPAAGIPPRARFGIPAAAQWFGDAQAAAAFEAAGQRLRELGVELVTVDFTPLFEVAALLYEGPWIAERQAAIGAFIAAQPDAVHPVVRALVEGGARHSAADLFAAQHRLAALRRQAEALIAGVDALLVPTAPTICTIAAMQADPVALNSRFGLYTNFVNLLDWCALALPAGWRDDGLPAGITLIASAWRDDALADFGLRWQRHLRWTLGATGRTAPAEPVRHAPVPEAAPAVVRLAVVGAHLSGMPLNPQLLEREAQFVERTTTDDSYRLYALPGTAPPKPGLVRGPQGSGAPIEVELWDMPETQVGSFLELIPPPLGLGSLTLADGRVVRGFICEGHAVDGATDITAHRGWRRYRALQA